MNEQTITIELYELYYYQHLNDKKFYEKNTHIRQQHEFAEKIENMLYHE